MYGQHIVSIAYMMSSGRNPIKSALQLGIYSSREVCVLTAKARVLFWLVAQWFRMIRIYATRGYVTMSCRWVSWADSCLVLLATYFIL